MKIYQISFFVYQILYLWITNNILLLRLGPGLGLRLSLRLGLGYLKFTLNSTGLLITISSLS